MGGEDSFRSTEGNMRVKDGSGLSWGVAASGKAAKEDDKDENFRG